jgi:cellulose synthase/poly-beta-1,6-N-acetylglucosamine synthase-like glycosyltransferase/phosphoglycerol transferase MdoB-like AlkP superfamily enzyme
MFVSWENAISEFFAYGLFIYSVAIFIAYLFLSFFSVRELSYYERKNKSTDFKLLAPSQHTPSISILAPAFNESATIVENVKSLLTIYYYQLQIVIINDGSKDDSMEKLIETYELVKTNVFVPNLLSTKPIRGVYKSTNPAYDRLVIVDKENGGKADSLNAGINIASGDIIVCVDVDCILEQDALFKIVKPFLDRSDVRVIASGGVVRIANSCIVEHGKLVKVVLPKQLLPRLQSLEYIRSFLLGRMAWSRLNGLLLISGAFGAFDKSIAIACGGYNTNTVGEDMELVVRMRRYMHEQKQKYTVTYIPEPLCWTEAPVSYKILIRQRNRWTRGTIETLRDHRTLFFNKKYGLLGLLSYPYWFFFEMLAAPIEFLGILFFLIMAILGEVNWPMFGWFFAFIWSGAFTFSAFAVLMEASTFNQYKNRGDTLKLLLAATIEPFVYHPIVVWAAINGFADYFQKVKSWGVMHRAGFAPSIAVKEVPLNDLDKKEFKLPVREFASIFAVIIGLFFISRAYEIGNGYINGSIKGSLIEMLRYIIIADLTYLFSLGFLSFIVFTLLFQLHQKSANILLKLIGAFTVVLQLFLSQYFLTALVPLGADIWGYSWAEIKQTVGASGVLNFMSIALIAFLIAAIVWVINKLPKKIQFNHLSAGILVIAMSIVFMAKNPIRQKNRALQSEYDQNLSLNKTYYLYTKSLNLFFPKKINANIYDDAYSGDFGEDELSNISKHNYINADYPFLHQVDSASDVLSPYFNKSNRPPNIVIVLVEGLGRAFTNEGAYLGNFTPFIDSLSKQSLYWPNFLSEGGRTFAVLPSLLGSLPFGQFGFSELGNEMPSTVSLTTVLKKNGYQNAYYYGGDSHFDFMDVFLKKNGVGSVNDIKSFGKDYIQMPKSASGFSWGYGDKELFRKYWVDQNKRSNTPFCNVLLTVSTHSPFLINEEATYLQKFEERLSTIGIDESKKTKYRQYKLQYASILFADDAIKSFFEKAKQDPDFSNTVFIITGDHRMPEIPMSTKIDRYHVPLIIYSPLLKRKATINAVSTHFDISPSVLQWLHHSYGLSIPNQAIWMGTGLDTNKAFRNVHSYPLMQTKNEVNNYIHGNLFLDGGTTYLLNENMELQIIESTESAQKINGAFNLFKQKNQVVQKGARLLPDSLIKNFGN